MAKQRNWALPLLALLLLIALIVAAVLLIQAARPPKTLRIAAGAKDGLYYAGAQQLSTALAEKGFKADVLETQGSLDNIQLLKEGKADVALIQGGVASFTDTTGLATVAMIGYETCSTRRSRRIRTPYSLSRKGKRRSNACCRSRLPRRCRASICCCSRFSFLPSRLGR